MVVGIFLAWNHRHITCTMFLARTCMGICHRQTRTRKNPNISQNIIISLRKWYTSRLGINGKYYLTKMYVAELFEHIQQVYSLTTIYLCLMPVEISIIVCIVLSVELAINIWLTMYLDSQEIRDRLVLLDILTDIFCIVFPLLYTWLSFQIPVSIPQMLFIVVYPTLSLFSKLEELWRDYFIIDLERIQIGNLIQNTNQKSVRAYRWKSILNL